MSRAKVIFNLKSSDSEVYYTQYNEADGSDRINAYWGCVQAFQSGSNAGKSKKYKNVNGLLKIESSKWKHPEIKQTPETRRDPENWDETHKVFISPEIKLRMINYLKEDERIDSYKKVVLFIYNNERYILYPGQCIEFGSEEHPEVKVY